MAPRPGPDLTKVTLNLYTSDVAKLKHNLGHGYSIWVRDLIHEKLRQPAEKHYEPYVAEDLDGE